MYLSNFQTTLKELQEEAQEYEKIKAGEVKQLKIDKFSQIPEILIKARITKRWNQKQLAEKLGLKPQQIQRYEATFYESASFTRILEVIDALGLKITGEVSL